MNEERAYDLPTRLFHWLFAMLFVFAFTVANVVDDDSPVYSYHMLAGIFMVYLVALRSIWGIVGSRYARFSSFELSPLELVRYLSSMFSSKSKRYMGHNPASSFAAFGMFAFTIGLGITGVMMSQEIGDDFSEDIHELCANGFIIIVVLHVVGVIFHQFKHKDGIIYSMITGRKSLVDNSPGIASNHRIVGVIFTGLVTAFAIYLYRNYDPNTQSLNVLGGSFELSEDGRERFKEKKQDHLRSDKGEDEHDD